MENKKVNFFAIPFLSFVPTAYKKLVKESGGKIFGVLIIFAILFSIIDCAMIGPDIDNVYTMVDEVCPDFTLSNGKLSCDEKVEKYDDGFILIVDDSVSRVSMDEFNDIIKAQDDVRSGFFVAEKNVVIYNASDGFNEVNFSDLDTAFSASGQSFKLSKDSVLKLIPVIKPVIYIFLVFGQIFSLFGIYLLSLVLQLVTRLFASIAHKELSGKEIYRMTVLSGFARYTLLYVLCNICSLFYASFLISLGINIAYLFVIILLYKEDSVEGYSADPYNSINA